MNQSTHSTHNTHITIRFSRGWLVTGAASGLGLVFGILYVWSVIKAGIPLDWAWSNADKALPYSVMAVSFSIVMVPAGQLQDQYGPRPIIMLGGFLAGLGCMVAGLGHSSLMAYVAGFGIITGAGVGFGYSALTPAAIKWFPPEKTGLVAGIVVAGSGLAPVPLAPITQWLLTFFSKTTDTGVVHMGVSPTMITLGAGIWLATACLVWFVYNPPFGFVPLSKKAGPGRTNSINLGVGQMLKTRQFWLLFPMYFSGASAGLVFISVAADLGRHAMGQWAFMTVVVLALGNTLGRILAGVISDRIGRQPTLFFQFAFQAIAIYYLFCLTRGGGGSWQAILAVVFIIGMNYGSNLTIFPAVCKDYFGMRNFGLNYGCLFTAFGSAGMIMPWLNGFIRDYTGRDDLAYYLIITLLLASALTALFSRYLGPPACSPTVLTTGSPAVSITTGSHPMEE